MESRINTGFSKKVSCLEKVPLDKSPNGLILGTPGSGKSFSAKREITNVVLITDDSILICDPESEYAPLVYALGGQVIKISPTSKQFINPLDINMNYSEEDVSYKGCLIGTTIMDSSRPICSKLTQVRGRGGFVWEYRRVS